MMYECSTGELLVTAAFMHQVDKGHITLKHYAAHRGVTAGRGLLGRCEAGQEVSGSGITTSYGEGAPAPHRPTDPQGD